MKTCADCHETKPLSEFYKNSRGAQGVFPRCKPCHNIRSQRWEKANPDRRRQHQRKKHLKAVYGITVDEYDALLAGQGGGCGICGAEVNGTGKRLYVDHDHDTGKVRGILCGPCNFAIGLLGDDVDALKKAIYYLEAHSG